MVLRHYVLSPVLSHDYLFIYIRYIFDNNTPIYTDWIRPRHPLRSSYVSPSPVQCAAVSSPPHHYSASKLFNLHTKLSRQVSLTSLLRLAGWRAEPRPCIRSPVTPLAPSPEVHLTCNSPITAYVHLSRGPPRLSDLQPFRASRLPHRLPYVLFAPVLTDSSCSSVASA